MKTIIHLDTNDDTRLLIAKSLGIKGMVSRKQLTEAVIDYVKGLADGFPEPIIRAVEPVASSEETQVHQPVVSSSEFKPSRGDEPYIYKAKDPALRDRLSSLLDSLEALEEYTWSKLEENKA